MVLNARESLAIKYLIATFGCRLVVENRNFNLYESMHGQRFLAIRRRGVIVLNRTKTTLLTQSKD